METLTKTRFYGPYEEYGYRNFLGVRHDYVAQTGKVKVALGEYHAILTDIQYRAWNDYVRAIIFKQARPNEKRYYELLELDPSPIRKPTLLEFFKDTNPGEGCRLLRFDPERMEYREINSAPQAIPSKPWVHLDSRQSPHDFRGEVSHNLRTNTHFIRVMTYIIETTPEGVGLWERYVLNWFEQNRGKRFVLLPDAQEWREILPDLIKQRTKVSVK